MATNMVVQADSALSTNTKFSTLSQEVVRRLQNTSKELGYAKRMEILEKFCVKMKTSGHSEKFIGEVKENWYWTPTLRKTRDTNPSTKTVATMSAIGGLSV